MTRFAVPRPEGDTAHLHRDPDWLEERLELFRRYYVPSVSRTGVAAVLLCSRDAAQLVSSALADLSWVRVEIQDEWHGGWREADDRIVTRLDSDDAIHQGWFDAVDRTPDDALVCVTRAFLSWDVASGRLHRYHRNEPSALAAFRRGQNPYALDHRRLDTLPGVHTIPGSYLLQVVHRGNVRNRPLKAWRIDRRESLRCLDAFGFRAADRAGGSRA